MQAYTANAPAIDRLWRRLRARIAAYPPGLRELGESFLAWAGPGYFSQPDAAPLLHLPLWLPRPLAPEVLDVLLEATALAYAYVRIQDNVVDEPETRGHPPLLLVANGLLWDALELYRRHGDAQFWAHAREAWFTFSEMTEAERRQVTRPGPYPHAAFVAHAQKCALAEVPLYACMAASGDWSGVEEVPRLVHALGRSYGAVNDVMGHARDLQSGARTWLLAAAESALAAAGNAAPSPAEVLGELHRGPHLDALLGEAITTLADAEAAAARLGMPAFAGFAAERSARLADLRARLTFLRLGAALAGRAA